MDPNAIEDEKKIKELAAAGEWEEARKLLKSIRYLSMQTFTKGDVRPLVTVGGNDPPGSTHIIPFGVISVLLFLHTFASRPAVGLTLLVVWNTSRAH